MFTLPQQNFFEMDSSMNKYARFPNSSLNSNKTTNQEASCYNSEGAGAYQINPWAHHLLQYEKANNTVKDTEYVACADILKNIKKHRACFTKPHIHQLVKKRKRRTVFHTEQVLTLEKIFNKKPYVSRAEREVLKRRLNVSERVIKVWFQNRRRLSGKKGTDMAIYSDSSEEESERKFDLDYVESKINRPDEFGYVTLDHKAMTHLMTAVDSVLTNVDLDKHCIEISLPDISNATASNIMNYEPISPVSTHDDEDDVTCLSELNKMVPYEPEESLRRLFDVQSFISGQLS